MRLRGVCYRNRANPRQPATNHKPTASTIDTRDIPPHITPTPEHYTGNYRGNYGAYNGETTLAKPQVTDLTTPPVKRSGGNFPRFALQASETATAAAPSNRNRTPAQAPPATTAPPNWGSSPGCCYPNPTPAAVEAAPGCYHSNQPPHPQAHNPQPRTTPTSVTTEEAVVGGSHVPCVVGLCWVAVSGS